MPLTVLPDAAVSALLHSLTKEDILDLQQSLADALHYYSTATGEEENGCSASYQPNRTSLKRRDGGVTLVMPASSNDGIGVKIVTVGEPDKFSASDDRASVSTSSTSGSGSGSGSASKSSYSIEELSISSNSSRSTTTASTSASSIPLYPASSVSSAPSDGSSGRSKIRKCGTAPVGSLTLFDSAGLPRALINASELTAFRTALASTMLFKKRNVVHDLTVFGAGKQAYWHIRLALLLRGDEVHHLNIVNRSFDGAERLVSRLYKTPLPPGGVEISHPKMTILTPGHQEYERILKSTVRDASVIFCTTPSLRPLFPASLLTNTEGRKKGRYIAAIGSYKPHMIELDPEIIRQATAPAHGHHHHRHAKQGGAIVVDSVDACLREAGELIQSGLGGREVVELGELIMLKKDAERRRKEREEGVDLEGGVEIGDKRKGKKGGNEDGGLMDWLKRGNVIYKSVGLGLMDVVVGGDLVRMADERKLGTRLEEF